MTAVAAPMPNRTHRLSIGVAGKEYYTQEIAIGIWSVIQIPEDINEAMLKEFTPGTPITVKVEPL